MLNIGWIDFSKKDRDMVMSVLKQLTEPGALDELGIGTIRDGFSDLLFPGTSTIQTRAKYFFIVSYICMELERNPKLTPRDFIEHLNDNEIRLIKPLVEKSGRGAGVIGEDAGERLQRKPSSIYWNALRKYGFFTEQATLSEYAALFCSMRNDSLRRKNDDDDADAAMRPPSFWRVQLPASDWRDKLKMNLLPEEAQELRSKIVSTPIVQDSLMALILRENRYDFIEYEEFAEIDALRGLMPDELAHIYTLARDFSRFVYGAQVRYNVIYSDGDNKTANDLWVEYSEKMPDVDLDAVYHLMKPRTDVRRFLTQFASVRHDTQKLDKLIIERERNLKKARAKLSNKEIYPYIGQNVNMRPLIYRMNIAQRIIGDIFKGEVADA